MSTTVTEAALPLFPLHTVLFPDGKLSLKLFEPRYLEMASACLKNQTLFGVCLIEEGREVGTAATVQRVGTAARLVEWDMPTPGVLQVTARGERRFRVLETWVEKNRLRRATVAWWPEPSSEPLTPADQTLVELLRDLQAKVGTDYYFGEPRWSDAAWVGARLVEVLPLPLAEKQALLEAQAREQLNRLRDWFQHSTNVN
jgi:hypothetical protein